MRRLPGRPLSNRSNPNCRDVAQVLQAYLDGEIDERDHPMVESHLEACRDCGLEADAYEAVKDSLRSMRPVVDDDVLGRLRAFARNVTSADQS